MFSLGRIASSFPHFKSIIDWGKKRWSRQVGKNFFFLLSNPTGLRVHDITRKLVFFLERLPGMIPTCLGSLDLYAMERLVRTPEFPSHLLPFPWKMPLSSPHPPAPPPPNSITSPRLINHCRLLPPDAKSSPSHEEAPRPSHEMIGLSCSH